LFGVHISAINDRYAGHVIPLFAAVYGMKISSTSRWHELCCEMAIIEVMSAVPIKAADDERLTAFS